MACDVRAPHSPLLPRPGRRKRAAINSCMIFSLCAYSRHRLYSLQQVLPLHQNKQSRAKPRGGKTTNIHARVVRSSISSTT